MGGLLKVREGFLKAALVGQKHPDIQIGCGVGRVDVDGLGVVGQRRRMLPQGTIGVTPVVIGFGVVWVDVDGVGVVGQRRRIVPKAR